MRGMHFIFLYPMRGNNIIRLVLIAGVACSLNVQAQNPGQPLDSTGRSHRSDSVDFGVPAVPVQRDSARQDNYEKPKRDTLPLDDRKPNKPPKK
jgi:hypothetical protein